MLYLFKKLSWKNWLGVIGILALTVLQVAFTMQICSNIGALTAIIQDINAEAAAKKELIFEYGFYILVCSLLVATCQIFVQILASHTASDFVTRIRTMLYEKINLFAMSDLSNFSTESLITRTTNDIQNIHLALLTALRTIFVAPITMIWAVIALLKYANIKLTITTVVWLVFLIIVVIILMIMVIPKFTIVQKLTDELNVASRENLTGVRVVRAFNAEKYQENKFEKINIKYTKAQIFAGRAVAFCTPVVTFVMMGLTLSILWISAYIINGLDVETARTTFAATNSFVMLATQIIMSFVLLVGLMLVWPRATICARRVKEILTYDEMVKDPEVTEEFKEKGTIEFRNVSYKYPGADKESVKNITFKVNRGETIAFIGATGSGKTTVINMIPRLADATSGEVLVDGVNVKNVRQKDLRDIIGYTPQRGFLFKGNIKDNIAFSNPELTLKDVEEAASIAEAHGFVSNKRQGYMSEVAQGGTNFSGGQKQRLCIARSVAKKPEILIFDDSFSALDYRTDKVVRANIKNRLPGTTRVIIAQRVGTIMDADQIVVLDNGEIVGLGKHYDLVRNCPVYQEIALSQLSREELGLTGSDAKGGK